MDTTIVPFHDEHAKPYQYLAIRYDITERKRMYLELQESETLTKLGHLAAVVAHEVKNPLAGIGGVIQIIGGRLPKEAPERAVIHDIMQRIDTLNSMVEDLLLFARPRIPKPQTIDILALLHDTIGHMKKDPNVAPIRFSIAGEKVEAQVDWQLLQEVFLNLLQNAVQVQKNSGAGWYPCYGFPTSNFSPGWGKITQ